MPTDHWLHVWCIWHTKKVETLQEFRSRHLICWIIQDFWETHVLRSLTFRLKTKMPWYQTPLTNEESHHVYLLGSTKRWIFKSMWNKIKNCGLESLKYVRVLHTGLLLWRHFHTPKLDAERNELWLVVWHVGQTASWAGLDQWMKNSCRTWYFCFFICIFSQKREIFFVKSSYRVTLGNKIIWTPAVFVHLSTDKEMISL